MGRLVLRWSGWSQAGGCYRAQQGLSRRGRLRSFLFFVLLLGLFLPPALSAAGTPEAFFKDEPNVPWHLAADEVSYDEINNLYIATGNVLITKGGKRLTADSVRFDHNAMKVFASGHVIVSTGEDLLSGNQIEFDLNSEQGTIHGGTLFLEKNHFYIRGDKIQKTGEATYMAENVSVTTCDGPNPDWKITGRKLQVTIEGYGTLSHAALWAKQLPILYVPYMVFPVKLKRQSGFLPPHLAVSSRKGFEYLQPFFWAISDHTDATLYLHHMGKRGEKPGAEYRYVLEDLSKGTIQFDFYDDRRIDDGTGTSGADWGYEDDTFLRPNSDRYWFRMKNDHRLPYDLNLKLDLDIVSDQDYLTEFKEGPVGFDATNSYFVDTFGRGLDDYTDNTRVNRLLINKIWPDFSLNAETRWNDNILYRRQKLTDAPLQQLPFIGLGGAKQPLLDGPLFYDLDTSYNYFYREEGGTGHRLDIYPRFYLPLRLKNYLAVEPSVGLRTTTWYADEKSTTPGEDRFKTRGFYDLRLGVSSDIERVFSPALGNVGRIKHTLRPEIVYEYTPDIDQHQYPTYDSLDRISSKNLLTYSLTHYFTSRSDPAARPIEGGATEAQPREPLYHQFARLKVRQSYDIDKARRNQPESFSPITGELDWSFNQYFSLRTDAEWDPYSNDFVSHNVAGRLSDLRGDRFFIEHRYQRDKSETIYSDLLVKLIGGFSIYADYERNIFNKKKIQSSLGVIYESQCWSLTTRYVDEETDRKLEFVISLYGLGEAGSSLSGRTLETPFK